MCYNWNDCVIYISMIYLYIALCICRIYIYIYIKYIERKYILSSTIRCKVILIFFFAARRLADAIYFSHTIDCHQITLLALFILSCWFIFLYHKSDFIRLSILLCNFFHRHMSIIYAYIFSNEALRIFANDTQSSVQFSSYLVLFLTACVCLCAASSLSFTSLFILAIVHVSRPILVYQRTYIIRKSHVPSCQRPSRFF